MRDRATAPVSVVIPCFKCEATIGAAVSSIAAQSLIPAEVILVDDCSPDNTLEVLQSIRASYGAHWIKVVSLNKNSGAGAARNAGWAASSGLFVAFLDSDDTWHPDKIALQYDWMVSNPAYTMTGHAMAEVTEISESKMGTVGFVPVEPWSLLFKNFFQTPTVMVRTDVPHRFNEQRRYSEDYTLWLDLAFDGHKMARSPAVLANMYKAPFGKSGLSANLLQMEIGEIAALNSLRKGRKISLAQWGAASVFSLLKFGRRCVIQRSLN